MPQRNGYRSQRGRSAIARKIMRSAGSNNGVLPQNSVVDQNGQTLRNAMFFGGDKKGGLAPRATHYFIASSSTNSANTSGNPRPNYFFQMKTQVGMGPRGLPGVGRVL